jgi:hypothetical protein
MRMCTALTNLTANFHTGREQSDVAMPDSIVHVFMITFSSPRFHDPVHMGLNHFCLAADRPLPTFREDGEDREERCEDRDDRDPSIDPKSQRAH